MPSAGSVADEGKLDFEIDSISVTGANLGGGDSHYSDMEEDEDTKMKTRVTTMSMAHGKLDVEGSMATKH